MNNIKPFGWRRHIDYLRANFFVMYKLLIEYKANIWSAIIIEAVYMSTLVFFFGVIISNFGKQIPWINIDFYLHYLLCALIFSLAGVFSWKNSLKYFIVEGDLNNYLTRPLNTKFMHNCSFLAPPAISFFVINFIMLIVFSLVYSSNYQNILLSGIVFVLIATLLLTFYLMTSSLDFRFLGISVPINNIYFKAYGMLEAYPAPYFMGLRFKQLFFIFPVFFVGSLLIPLIRGYDVWRMDIQLSSLIAIIILFFTIFIINWNSGLKKYEAFG